MCSIQLSNPLNAVASREFCIPLLWTAKGIHNFQVWLSRLVQHNREWILIGAKSDTSKYFGSEVSLIFSINFYTNSNNFGQVFIDFLSVKPLFQISNGRGSKWQKNRKETVIYPLPFFSPKCSFLILSAVGMTEVFPPFWRLLSKPNEEMLSHA